jgi:hypothetical protein
MANYVKPKSQNEKRIDAGVGGGGSYYAGEGLRLINGNQFALNAASQSGLGGIYIMGTKTAVFGEEDAAMGIYKESNFAALRTATQTQKGGFFLGDGLVPVLKETTNSEGEKAYTFSDIVQLRLGDGLYFKDNSETPGSLEEERENDLGGRKVAVAKATKEAFGIVKLGALLDIDEEGRVSVILTAGNGIDISPTGIVAVRVDGDSVRFNDDGQLESRGVEIQNAVVMQAADAKYLLHEYTEVDFIQGNRIAYAGAQNQIVTQAYITYARGGKAPNGVVVDNASGETLSSVPNIPIYGEIRFSELAYNKWFNVKISRLWIKLTTAYAGYDNYDIMMTTTDGTEQQLTGFTDYKKDGNIGLALLWGEIYPPGYVNGSNTYPYGCAACTFGYKYGTDSGYKFELYSGTDFLIGFASEAEYNAAVGLTYEPNTLTEVQETITEV